jgi:hypothetical protein
LIRLHVYTYGRLFFLFLFLSSCSAVPRGHFIPAASATDYSNVSNWAALPTLKDSADCIPIEKWKDEQSLSNVDVFFIHPTTYTGKSGEHDWNASLTDQELNLHTDQTTIKYQASIFNGAGRIYAPRYRQAHLHCFYEAEKKQGDAKAALDLAYEDVRNSFLYYLQHYNGGRPFIIAAHSQGTLHAAHLIKEEIENKSLQKQLVVAYLPGMPVKADYFSFLKPCTTPNETGCFCTWRTFRENYIPKKYHQVGQDIIVTNPVTWNDSLSISEKQEHLGAVLRDFHKVWPGLIETNIHEDLLWVNKPKFPGSFLFMTKNYHIADYNFFYADVRQNAQERVKSFLNHNGSR